MLFNASELDLPWTVPAGGVGPPWIVELDTDLAHEPGTELAAGGSRYLAPRSMVLLRTAAAPRT